MAFPTANDTFGPDDGNPDGGLARARRAWTRVAHTIAAYEPVTVIAHPDDVATAREYLLPAPSAHTAHPLTVITAPLNDAWLRDSGPTFTLGSDGGLCAVNWVFNGWGNQAWASHDLDARLATLVAARSGADRTDSPLVNEGGGLHVDGRGTVLLTQTVQLDPERNPGWTAAQVEAEVHARLGTRHAVWLPRSLTRDYDGFGTRGHVDIVAAFTESGSVLLHRQDNPAHPDYDVTRELRAVLEAAVDAAGNPLRIVDLPAPSALRDMEGWVDYSYLNHLVCNGAVILCAFDEPEADERARSILAAAYPGRTVELVDARDIFAFGGGIHCITQQQPAVSHD